MRTFLLILQLVVSVSLVVIILLQAKGSGLSGVFGGEGAVYRSRRGVEKMLVYLTIILGVVFLVLSVTQVLISK